jgi:hypothetical protein
MRRSFHDPDPEEQEVCREKVRLVVAALVVVTLLLWLRLM